MNVWWTVAIVVGLAGLAIAAYAARALDLLGAVGSFVLGVVVAIVGGVGWVTLMVVFTLLGVVATRVGFARKAARRVAEGADGERGIGNVLANGLAPTLAALAILADPIVPTLAVQLAFTTAVAAVASDTMASELGTLAARARRIFPPFAAVPVGENGAVSLAGQVAAAVGAITIAAAAIPLVGVPVSWAWLPAAAGFLGCQFDSLLGATLERDHMRDGPLSKGDVNFIASAVPALVVLMAFTL